MGNTKFSPIATQERKDILDFLRGIALFGILLVNISYFNSPVFTQAGGYILWDDLYNKITKWFIWFFFEGKFYPLFAVLFGAGFYFFINKAEQSIRTAISRYRMRLLYLLLFGMLHVLLLWYGDILIVYSLFGFIMTLFAGASERTIIIWAIVFILLPIVITLIMVGSIELMMMIPEAAEEIEVALELQEEHSMDFIKQALAVYSSGTFAEIFNVRINEYLFSLNGIIFMFPNIVSLFLLGLLLARNKIFHNISVGVEKLKMFFYWCLPVAVVLNISYVYFGERASMMAPDWNSFIMIASFSIGGPAMMLVYIYLFSFLYVKGVFRNIGGYISKTGRMAFTNYIAQSVICTTIFFSYGLGLYGKVNYWQGILIALAIYPVQLIWSHYWLEHFRFGPVEWLWRTLTYMKLQPMRKENSG